MTNILINSLLSLFGVIIGFRFYCVYFVWNKCQNKNLMKGKTVIITGSNSGIGKETAKELARRGARVVMACRDPQSAHMAIKQIKSQILDAILVYKHIDLRSFDSIKEFAEDIIRSEESVDLLINNAAVFECPFEVTSDGFESQFQVNHLSNALLTLLLLPKLESSSREEDRSRILIITSTLYRKGVINENDFKKGYASLQNYEITKAYSNSKLANLLFHRRFYNNLKNQNKLVDTYIASPGIVWTNLSRHLNMKWWKVLLLSPFGVMFVRTAKQGSQTAVDCATNQSLMADTLYRNCREHVWDAKASDSDLSKKVFDVTLKAIESHLKPNNR